MYEPRIRAMARNEPRHDPRQSTSVVGILLAALQQVDVFVTGGIARAQLELVWSSNRDRIELESRSNRDRMGDEMGSHLIAQRLVELDEHHLDDDHP